MSAAQVGSSRKFLTMNSSNSRIGTRWTPGAPASRCARLAMLERDAWAVAHLVLIDDASDDIVHQRHPDAKRRRGSLDHHGNRIAAAIRRGKDADVVVAGLGRS